MLRVDAMAYAIQHDLVSRIQTHIKTIRSDIKCLCRSFSPRSMLQALCAPYPAVGKEGVQHSWKHYR